MMKRLPVTSRGAALGGGSTALVAGGLLAADGLFVVLGGCGFILMLSAWLLGIANLKGLVASLHLPTRISAGLPFDLELTLHNHRPLLDAFQTDIRLVLPGKTEFQAIAPWTAAGSASRIIRQVTIPGRVCQDSHTLILSTTFPLGLFRCTTQKQIRKEILVTPLPIIPVELSSHGSLHDAMPSSGRTSGQTFGEPRGIRPWQPGDSARHIHWPASARSLARGHGLRIREYAPPGFHPDQCHIIFHSHATGREMLREDRFERALSLLTGTLLEFQKNGIPCLLSCDFFDWEPITCTTRKQAIESIKRLARVRRSTGTEAHDLEGKLRAVAADHTLVVISDMSPDSWQHLLAKHPQSFMIDIRQIAYRRKTMQTAV